MTAALHRICLAVLLAGSMCAGGSAEAGQIKYTYLKIGEGEPLRFILSGQSKPAKRHDASTT